MHLFSQWTARFGRVLRAANIALDPGEDDDTAPPNSSRVMLSHDDLLWFKTSQDEEGWIPSVSSSALPMA